jgi:ABC-type uncharacterized transport system substrate-binding protein
MGASSGDVCDPPSWCRQGLVERLNQPGGNITGFANWEPTLAGKWLELLSEIAPGLKRAAIMFNPVLPGAAVYSVVRSAMGFAKPL